MPATQTIVSLGDGIAAGPASAIGHGSGSDPFVGRHSASGLCWRGALV